MKERESNMKEKSSNFIITVLIIASSFALCFSILPQPFQKYFIQLLIELISIPIKVVNILFDSIESILTLFLI